MGSNMSTSFLFTCNPQSGLKEIEVERENAFTILHMHELFFGHCQKLLTHKIIANILNSGQKLLNQKQIAFFLKNQQNLDFASARLHLN